MIEHELERTLELARISATTDDLAQLARDVEAILEHFSVLAGADLDQVPAHSDSVIRLSSLRLDEVGATRPDPGALLGRAPETDQGFVLVPAVI